jgi:fructose-1,6-bisphosphatase/inositol monophosphatase family enzyme
MGVVYAPMTNELYIGVRHYGSFRNGIRLLGCTGEKANKTLSDSVVCFEFGYSSTQEGIDNMVNAVKRLLQHGVRTTRTLGSGVLDLCYVACGRMDVVYTGMAEEGWKPWDYCAGLVVAVEAGCDISHLKKRSDNDLDDDKTLRKGYKFNLYSKSMICGVNSHLVEQCRSVIVGLQGNDF